MYFLYLFFPIKNNRIIFNSYRGGQYSCSPKYISERLLEMYPGKYEIIWCFNDPEKFSFLEDKGIQVVKFASLKRLFYEATAKISINNVGSFSYLPLRKGQEHINTWHGAFNYKKCALSEIKNDKIMKYSIWMTTKETSLFLSANSLFTRKCLEEDFDYHGSVFEKGLPRNDKLVLGDYDKTYKNILKSYNINEDEYVVLYAPTWRYSADPAGLLPDFNRIKNSVEKRFNKKCRILFRSHHITRNIKIKRDIVIDVTDYKDTQDLLCISDMMITDYSSMIWDFSLMMKPCLLYTPDIESYTKERGFHIPIEEWGFTICRDNEALEKAILDYSEEQSEMIIRQHHKKLGDAESGHAAEEVCKWIDNICEI